MQSNSDIKGMKITIPQRAGAPETSLWVNVITQNTDPSSLGKNRSVMLLVPGGPGGNHTVYDEIKDELFKYADLIQFDPRGCGYSDPSDARYCTIDHYRDDIEAIREFFGIEKIILFGHKVKFCLLWQIVFYFLQLIAF